jgi:excisionase family DNA binding protein
MQQLLSKKEVAERIGLHPESVMRLVRAGSFPRPVRLGASQNCSVRFSEDEVNEWLNAKLAARRA